ncbi:cupin domain-containing protein [Aequorivita capsosiphonis]|uniref:cupin domain-containing protein n=1 Tax=Aequorivita capsosiphonis TaxID=487317 RepID=UPI00040D9AC4|nr:cupin domain-containing protein [Aequorivita capsosiphonis]
MTMISNPKVKLLEDGENLRIKQMSGDSGQFLPKHKASHESILVVIEGECVIRFDDKDHVLAEGDSLVVPANLWHQIEVKRDLRALHIMPKEIGFEFTK